jgi:hypothetical protein
MNKQEVLTKAIGRAIAGGWHMFYPKIIKFSTMVDSWGVDVGSDTKHIQFWLNWRPNSHPETRFEHFGCSIEKVIFDHDFAKALFGEPYVMSHKEAKEAGYMGGGGQMIDLVKGAGWQYHLQRMVVAENPIQYLADNMGADDE